MSSFQHILNDEHSIYYSQGDNEYTLLDNKKHKVVKHLNCVATLECDINNQPSNSVDTLFDNDYFIERVMSDCIIYQWFKEK